MTRIIFHIDVNSAYLSWTAISLLKKGEPTDLRTIPSIIGGSIEDRHGIVLAKSTPAKKHGIVTGEPIIQAMQKCPNLIAYPPDFALYSKCSRAMFDILSEYSDRIEPFSIDEGFLDYTGMEALFGPPIEAAKAIQKRILAELGFTVNIGISTNKLLAKMAGELEKPNKCITLFPEEIETKFWPLPIEDLFMVGRRTAPRLRKMGIRTVGELAAYPPLLLEKEYVEFLVGRNGDFDQIVSSAVKRQQRRVRDDNSALILLLPYPTAELRDNLENFEAYYDEIELCSAAAGIHPKGAIQIRNRQMVDRSDLVVFCVNHSSGGAYQTLRYAQKKKK